MLCRASYPVFMPVEMAIWKLGTKPEPVQLSGLDQESTLENALKADLSIVDPDLMLLATQVQTDHGKRIDVLAMDRQGDLVILELKRDKTPREVVTQALDYAAWIKTLSAEKIEEIYAAAHPDTDLPTGFADAFGTPEQYPEAINLRQRMIIVASSLDAITERIVAYLSEFGVPVNAVFFRAFKQGDTEYLARTWLIDPNTAEQRAEGKTDTGVPKAPWNGLDYYVSFGEDQWRNWEDARAYGFVSAGKGKWYSNSLKSLKPGDRVSVHIPQQGYVGVGEVTSTAAPARDAQLTVDGQDVAFKDLTFKAQTMHDELDDDQCEWVVGVKWLETVPTSQAYWEKGMFANQNSACKLRSTITLEAMRKKFPKAFSEDA
ncbi:endonuclease NucS [Deinococcus xinjiangensis]|uniref:Endonuclease NucS n=2 Tax=Deinococcus xinjiangensis TaxID=457454 RepID=A0ABP9VJ98_9DEIO